MFTTDKVGHGYLPTYLGLAGELGTAARVLEIGVASGESLQLWQALFPHGEIVGVDRNQGAIWPPNTRKVVADQTDPSLAAIVGYGYDLVIDDASHDNDLTRVTWLNLWGVVIPGRFYVIEDWTHAGGLIRGFAGELLDCFREADPLVKDVEDIRYRPGQIVLRKRKGA